MQLIIVLLTATVLMASIGLEASYSYNSFEEPRARNFSLTQLLSRLTCPSNSTCDGIANAYIADRGVGCSTECGGSFRTFVRAGLSGLRYCSRRTAPANTEFIEDCYCCFGYVLDRDTNTCILPSACTADGFGTY